MHTPLANTQVNDVIAKKVISISSDSKIEEVARLFESHRINAAPVIDSMEKCIGVFTSRDIVRYEAHRVEVEKQCRHGFAFDVGHYRDDDSLSLIGRPFDEVSYHMSTDFQTIEISASLQDAAHIMCRNSLHHLVALDKAGRAVGIVSTLDILSSWINEPVTRSNHGEFLSDRGELLSGGTTD